MKCYALTFLFFGVFTLFIQGNENKEKENVNKVKNIHFYMEMIEIDAIELADIMSEPSSSSDHTELRNKVFAMVKAGKAKLIENQSMLTDTVNHSIMSSQHEFYTFKKYQSAAFVRIPKDQKGGQSKEDSEIIIMPPSPVELEEERIGFHMEINTELVKNVKNKTHIKTTLNGRLMSIVGYRSFGSWKTKNVEVEIKRPIYSKLKLASEHLLQDSKFMLIRTHDVHDGGKENPSRKILMFIKADILGGELTAAQKKALLMSKYENDDAGDPFDDSKEPPFKKLNTTQKQLSLYFEMIEMDAIDYAEIAAVKKSDKDFTATRNKLIKMVQQGKATLVESQTVVKRYDHADVQTGRLFPFDRGANQYRPSMKEALGYTLPFPLLQRELKQLGLGLRTSYTLNESNQIRLSSAFTYTTHEGDSVQQKWKSFYANTVMKKPMFHTLHHDLELTLDNGTFSLLSTHTPFNNYKNHSNRKVIVMVKPTLLRIEQ